VVTFLGKIAFGSFLGVTRLGTLRAAWSPVESRPYRQPSRRGTNKAQLEQWVRDYGEDSGFVRARVRGLFPHAGSMQFISSELVEAAARADRYIPSIPDEPLIMGVDVARFGAMSCCSIPGVASSFSQEKAPRSSPRSA
jgi:hypothetical protein